MTARYALADVPESGEPDRSRFALSKSTTGQSVSCGQAMLIAHQTLLQEMEGNLDRLAPATVTVEVPKVAILSDGSYVLQQWRTVSQLPTFKNLRPTQFAGKAELAGGALIDDWLGSVEGFSRYRDDHVCEAWRSAAEREGISGWNLTNWNKTLLKALCLRAGILIDTSSY